MSTTAQTKRATCAIEDLESYSGLYRERAEVCRPATVAELQSVFARAQAGGRRVTVRAGGHAFDAQSLGCDVVVSTCAFDAIRLDRGSDPQTVTVGAGATWGAIVRALAEDGFVAPVTVTTKHATAGGTLAGDCLSRFSPSYGKLGLWIDSFEIVTVGGDDQLTCRPPAMPGTPWGSLTLEEQLFFGVIGGLGYLGAVTSITFRVVAVDRPVRVATTVRESETFEELADALVPAVRQMEASPPAPKDRATLDAIYSAIACEGGREQALLMRSSYTTEDLDRMPLHRPAWPPRILVEWLMRIPAVNRWIWTRAFRHEFHDKTSYVDELEGFTFFMDGNVNARRVARWFGRDPKIVQQTFIVPAPASVAGDHTAAKESLVGWLRMADGLLDERDLHPTLADVLYLPCDERFLLSATADLAGFAVTYTFETSDAGTLAEVRQAFSDLTERLHTLGGRVYLVKNVFAEPGTIRAMYATNAPDFRALKARVDPDGVLVNDFLERTFGWP